MIEIILWSAATSLAAFLIGWHLSVRKFTKAARKRQALVANMLEQLEAFHEMRNKDPQRAWTNIGIDYTISRLKIMIAELQEEQRSRS